MSHRWLGYVQHSPIRADQTQTAEARGVIEQAEHRCSKVLQLLQDQALNA